MSEEHEEHSVIRVLDYVEAHDLHHAMVIAMCENIIEHRPRPLRVVEHHIIPVACGGLSVASNKLRVCDVDHYAIHELMRWARDHDGTLPPRVGDSFQQHYALEGYMGAVTLGTVDKIPSEGNLIL